MWDRVARLFGFKRNKADKAEKAAKTPKRKMPTINVIPSTPAGALSPPPSSTQSRPKSASAMSSIFAGKSLHRNAKDHPSVTADALNDKVVVMYFSAHWCPPCKAFTPVLKDFYEEVTGADKPLEIVFVSLDRSEKEMKEYLDECHGEWLWVYGDDAKSLADQFDVKGIPALLVLKADGTVAVTNGRGDVQGKGPAAFDEWKTAAGL